MAGDLEIRDYRDEDFELLCRIDKACFEPRIAYSRSELAFYLRHPGSATMVAEIGGKVSGFVLGRLERASVGHVITLDVLAEFRRRRVGTELMKALHREFLRRRVQLAILEVNAEDAGARKFYESLHYRYADVLPGYYDGRIDACRMYCLLKQAEPRP